MRQHMVEGPSRNAADVQHRACRLRPDGFLFYDGGVAGQGLSDEREAFLKAGPPPLVFTLGSVAVYAEGGSCQASAATRQNGLRG